MSDWYSTVCPLGWVSWMDLVAQPITPLYLTNQSIPRMISSLLDSRMMRLDGKSTPLMLMLTLGQSFWVFIFPPGVLTIIGSFINAVCKLFWATNEVDMNECVAPESKRTVP